MTAKKTNPQRRGRPKLKPGTRELVFLRWRAFKRDADPKIPEFKLGEDFILRNREWLKSIEIVIANYHVLRNVESLGEAERSKRRRDNWGIVDLPNGKKTFSKDALLIRGAVRAALDVSAPIMLISKKDLPN